MIRIIETYSQDSPTITAGVYASGQLIGGKLTFLGVFDGQVNTAEVRQVIVYDKAKQGVSLDLILFSSDPSATTFTDNATFAVGAADLTKISTVIPISTHSAFSTNGVSYAVNISQPIFSTVDATTQSGRRTIYGALVSRGAPTYASTSDLTVRINIIQD